jgi:hypothetical protein
MFSKRCFSVGALFFVLMVFARVGFSQQLQLEAPPLAASKNHQAVTPATASLRAYSPSFQSTKLYEDEAGNLYQYVLDSADSAPATGGGTGDGQSNLLLSRGGGEGVGSDDPTGVDSNGGRIVVPAEWRGTWIEGVPGHGTFKYSDMPYNEVRGIAGLEVQFENGHIKPGGWPAHVYWNGKKGGATVKIGKVTGTNSDFTNARDAMREKLRKAKVDGWESWTKPKGYTWNHTGDKNSTTMELIKTKIHKRVKHKGSAAFYRALLAAKAKRARVRGLLIVDAYQTFKDAVEFAQNDPLSGAVVTKDTSYFIDETGSVFYVQEAGLIFGEDKRIFVDGPKVGTDELLTDDEILNYKEIIKEKYGWVEKDIFGRPYRFHPGTHKKRIIISNPITGEVYGHMDKDGVHYYPDRTFKPTA